MFCQQPADFEKVDIDEKHRGKKCSLCGKIKILEKAHGQYRTVDGTLQLLMEDGEYHEVALMQVKGGVQILPIN